MPRSVRRGRTAKRPTKWCAAIVNAGVPKHDLLAVTDAVRLCQPTTAVPDQQDIVAGGIRGQINITRIQKDDDDPVIAWAIVMGRTAGVVSAGPVQVFDPFLENDLERQDILGMGYIAAPPILLNGADVAILNQQSSVVDVHIKTSRKVDRNWNNLFFWIASSAGAGAGTDNSFRCQASFRTLMKF